MENQNNEIVSREEIVKTLNENGITCSVRYHIANKSFIRTALMFSVFYYLFTGILTMSLQQYMVLGIIAAVVLALTALVFITLYILQYVQKEKFRNKFQWKSQVFGMLQKNGYTDRDLNMIELHMKFPTVLNVWGIFMGLMAVGMAVIIFIFNLYDQTDFIFWIKSATIIHLAIYMLCFAFICLNLNFKSRFIERWIYFTIKHYEENDNK